VSEINEVVKIEVKKFPKLYIIGKQIRYSFDALDKGDNRLPAFWDKCINENIFAPLESQIGNIYDISYAGVFLDWYLGDSDFTYIVGMLMEDGTVIPDGYIVRELAETEVALCWVKCKELAKTRVVSFESTDKAIKKIGRDFSRMKWCIDLYDFTRSMTPDENGYVILDCYIPLD
jgi:predicted transcriptional regulator YdeE